VNEPGSLLGPDAPLRRFLGFVRPHLGLLLLVGGLVVATRLVSLPMPLVYRALVDQALPGEDLRLLGLLVGGMAALLLGGRGLGFARQVLSAKLQQAVLHDVRLALYAHLQRLDLGFYRQHTTGGLLSRIVNDVRQVQSILSGRTFEVLASLAQIVVVAGLLLWLNPHLSLVSALVFPVLVLLVALFQKRIYRISRAMQERHEALSARLQENLAGLRLIQALTLEQRQLDATAGTSAELRDTLVRSELIGSGVTLLTVALTDMPLTLLVWGYGGYLVVRGELTLGSLLAFHQYLMMLYSPVIQVFRFNIQLQVARAALDRLYELLDARSATADVPQASALQCTAGDLRFEGVTLRYGADEPPALRCLDLHVEAGEVLGLVGPSGAGKSTLVNGLLRFLPTTEGRILLDGQDIAAVSAESLRRQVGLVAQEGFLFGDTLAANIALGDPGADEARIEAAARDAQAHEFIERLERGYETGVGERGLGLSGGERQRVALARTFLQDPPVLVLDEATSALDARSEALVQEALARLVRGRTVIIIAHRFSTLKLCDRIAVLSGGRLAELGTHTELAARPGGLYRTLLQAQLLDAPTEQES